MWIVVFVDPKVSGPGPEARTSGTGNRFGFGPEGSTSRSARFPTPMVPVRVGDLKRSIGDPKRFP
jgi:hypothetical protein